MKDKVAAEIASRVKKGEVLGVGTGTTVDAALTKIAERVRSEGLTVSVVPTSYETAWRCAEIGLTVVSPETVASLSWGFDGADAVDPARRLIKGKGGALLKEKVLAKKCSRFVVIVDQSKLVKDLAQACPIPVEVLPEALLLVQESLRTLGATSITLRQGTGKHGPTITEAGNLIVDVAFPRIGDTLERDLKSIVGVVESGLFCGYAHEVLVAYADGVRSL